MVLLDTTIGIEMLTYTN